MSVTISIRFLTGRAHLHPWQTHHSEGRVEWPPSQWRLLRALVAVAGRGLTSLPYPDFIVEPGKKPKPTSKIPDPVWPSEGYEALPDSWCDESADEITLSDLAGLLHALSETPSIWLPKSSGGHTRQYFPIHSGGMVKNSGSAVFDTFAAVRKDEPLLFHWPNIDLSDQQLADLRLLLSRISYFGRAESWSRAEAHTCPISEIIGAEMSEFVPEPTHWECRCIDDHGKPAGQEYRDYLLERRLAPVLTSQAGFDVEEATKLFSALKEPTKLEASKLLSKFPQIEQADWSCWHGRLYLKKGKLFATGRWTEAEIQQLSNQFASKEEKKLIRDLLTKCMMPQVDFEIWKSAFGHSTPELILLRCLLRESGQDIKDGLERPIGTRWVHYAVPRAIYDIPRAKPQPRPRTAESVDLVRYALNTATVDRAVLPAVTDTLLVAEKFRNVVMALSRNPSRAVSGHEPDGTPCSDHRHSFWWPLDEDNDGFIDHVVAWAPGGFEHRDVDALRRLTRLRQRGGRPDLLVTPVFVGGAQNYRPWQSEDVTTFVSATPYFCPIHLSHGRKSAGRIRSLKRVVIKSLQVQGVIESEQDVLKVEEIIFDYVPEELNTVVEAVAEGSAAEPIPPRQFFPVISAPDNFPPLPEPSAIKSSRYEGAALKDADDGYCFGSTVGLRVDKGTRFVRALSFCRRRRRHEVRGRGRMLQIAFARARSRRPFAIGDQCHFGLGLFVPDCDRNGA